MRIKVNAKSFIEALKTASLIIEKSPFPVIENVKIVVKDNEVNLLATNLIAQITIKLDDIEILEKGTIMPNTKALINILKKETDEVILHQEGTSLIINTEKTKCELYLYNHEQFSYFDTTEKEIIGTLNFSSEKLLNALKKVSFIPLKTAIRAYLTGVCIESKENEVKFIASDNHRLAIVGMLNNENGFEMKKIIPIKTVKSIEKIVENFKFDEVKLIFSEKFLEIHAGNILIASKYVDDHFPEINQLIEKTYLKELELTDEFYESIDRTLVFTDEDLAIKIELDGKSQRLTLSSENPEIGKFQKTISNIKTVNVDGAESFAFNPKYIINARDYFTADKVLFDSAESIFCFINSNSDVKYLAMPKNI